MTTPAAKPEFYLQDLWPVTPLLDSPAYNGSKLDYLAGISNNAIHPIKLQDVYGNMPQANFAWRIVDVEIVEKDDIMSYFRAYNVVIADMQIISTFAEPYAAFGVQNGGQHSLQGGFKYSPVVKHNYFIAQQGEFMTYNTEGYAVMVLDYNYPSEAMAIGHVNVSHAHQGCIVTFALLPLDVAQYPHDYPSKPGR